MKKGFITPLILLAIVSFGGYYIFKTYAKYPSATTQETAANIIKYPNAKTWDVKNTKNICILTKGDCAQPATISFGSADSWTMIYTFYKNTQTHYGWQTNSMIVTSVPDDITFTNAQNCTAHLGKNSLGFFGLQKPDNGKFTFTISCKD